MQQEDILKLVPKDKFDQSTLDKLMEITEEDIQIILPELFEWISDFNWPIAKDIITVLVRFPNSLVPLIQNALNVAKNDDILKYWIIVKLIPILPDHIQEELLKDIKRICEHPTIGEEIEGICKEAKRFLKRYYS